MRILWSFLVTLPVLAPTGAFAWSDDGHRIVALIADHYLAPAARDKVNALLKSDTDPTTAHDIASEATWADKVKDASRTAEWHFMQMPAGRPNIPQACGGHPALPAEMAASEGPAAACIVDKINQFSAELSNSGTSAREKLLALKYLLNLVADIHQPLRVVDEGNRHGAGLPVTAPLMTPGDLFGFWETTIVSRLESDASPNEVARLLTARISEADAAAWGSRTPQLWALESYQLGVDRAYGMVNGYDDQGRPALQDREIEQAMQTAALQLSRAGVRLAYVLNEALAAPTVAPATIQVKAGDPVAGRLFAQGPCAVCHNVTARQNNASTMAPDFTAIAKTSGITGGALSEFLTGPHPTMPNMHLTQKQQSDVIAYILSLR